MEFWVACSRGPVVVRVVVVVLEIFVMTPAMRPSRQSTVVAADQDGSERALSACSDCDCDSTLCFRLFVLNGLSVRAVFFAARSLSHSPAELNNYSIALADTYVSTVCVVVDTRVWIGASGRRSQCGLIVRSQPERLCLHSKGRALYRSFPASLPLSLSLPVSFSFSYSVFCLRFFVDLSVL